MKLVSLLFISSLLFIGCNQSEPPKNTKFKIVATTPVLEHFAKRLSSKTNAFETSLAFQSAGHCLHEHSVSVEEMKRLCSANLIIANGVGFEPFLEDAMKQCPKVPVINVAETCADLLTSEGKPDPHVWLGAKSTSCMLATLTKHLMSLDSTKAPIVEHNHAALQKSIDSTWMLMQPKMNSLQGKTAVSFHGTFGYFARDLQIKVVASFGEELEQSSPSAQEIAMLIQKIRSEQVTMLLANAADLPELALTIEKETSIKIIPLKNMMEAFDPNDQHAYEHILTENMQLLTP